MAANTTPIAYIGSTLEPWPSTGNVSCERQEQQGNKTYHFAPGYSGIPDNLVLNLIVWLFLTVFFVGLRRLIVFSKEGVNLDTGEQYSYKTSFFGWIPHLYKIKDEDIVRKFGPDALTYLIFERYLIVFLTVVCVLSIGVILPVNYHGELLSNPTSIGRTTIGNVKGSSNLLWVHCVVGAVYLIVGIVLMKIYSRKYLLPPLATKVNRTLLITNIPSSQIDKRRLENHFINTHEGITIEGISYVYDVREVLELNEEKTMAHLIKEKGEDMANQEGEREQFVPRCLGCMCGSCHCCKKADLIEYYTIEEEELTDKYEESLRKSILKPLNMAFITFTKKSMAIKVLDQYNGCCRTDCYAFCPQYCLKEGELNEDKWNMRFAPYPEDIYWENLSQSPWVWYFKFIIFNVLMVIILLLFTTPSVVLNSLEELRYQKLLAPLNSPLLVNVAPVLMLWLFSALLPNLVLIFEGYIHHSTRSTEQTAITVKTFVYILLMILILPSLGLTSAKALIDYFKSINNVDKFRWACIFLPDNGAFFVNYVITAAFIGTSVANLQIGTTLYIAYRYIFAKSRAERAVVRKRTQPEFPYGQMYAWLMCIVCVIMSYSIICPLITPFGLFYMVLKYVCDKHSLCYVFKPSTVAQGPHQHAVNFVYTGILITQLLLFMFTTMRADHLPPTSIFSLCMFIFGLVYLAGDAIYLKLKQIRHMFLHLKGDHDEEGAEVMHHENEVYLPEMLLSEDNKQMETSPSSDTNQTNTEAEGRETPDENINGTSADLARV